MGHVEGSKLGGLDGKQITDVVQKLTHDGASTVDKVALVGCGTACAKDGPSLVSEVSGLLQQQGLASNVKGYDTPVAVDDQGRKQSVAADAADALGKDDLQPASQLKQTAEQKPAKTELAVTPTESVIWNSERDGIITHETASYLDALHSKVSEKLKDGPVLIGENHEEPNAKLLIQQLISENKVDRIVIETPPLEMLSSFAQSEKTKRTLNEVGFDSLDDYFSNFDDALRNTDFHKEAQRKVLKNLREATDSEMYFVVADAMKAGLHLDLIDGARNDDTFEFDQIKELTDRNIYMTEKLSADAKYKEPRVLGLFGYDHLRTYVGSDGTLKPAIQQTLNLAQDRVYESAAMFHDFTSGQRFFPWQELGTLKNQTAEMSKFFPYKQTADQQFEARTNKSHIIIDGSGGIADEHIKRIAEQRPSSNIIFKPSDTQGVQYVSGQRVDVDDFPAKAYLFGKESSDSAMLDRLLMYTIFKLDADLADFSIKKIYLDSPQTPVHAGEKSPDQNVTADTEFTNSMAAGEDAAAALGPPPLSIPSSPSQAPDFIAQARAEGMISQDSKEYLDQVKLVITEQLTSGPVLLGEYHMLPEAPLLTKQLISENKVKRLLLEAPPLSELLHDEKAVNISNYMVEKNIPSFEALAPLLPALGEAPEHIEEVLHWQEKIKPFADKLNSSGWASLENYLANFQPSDTASETFRQAQYLFSEATAAVGSDEYNTLASHALSSGTQIAFVDGGRTLVEYIDDKSTALYDGDSFHLRNLDIANRIKPDENEIAAGTLGLFGLGHLKTSASNQGNLNPALQELLNISEDRVHQIMPMFADLQSGKEYFPSLTQPKASHAGASIAHPFKFVPEHDQPNNAEGFYQERKNRSHVIVNLVGDKAASVIEQIQAAHPSSSITFSGDLKGLHYESGITPNFRSDVPTKVYLLHDPANPTLAIDFVLRRLGKMLGRNEKNFKVKEGSLESDSGADTNL